MKCQTAAEAVTLVEMDELGCIWFKYVRVGNEFRFSEITLMHVHIDMISKGERVASAGIVEIRKDCFKFRDYGSVSLHVGWSNDDVELLKKVLNRPSAAITYR